MSRRKKAPARLEQAIIPGMPEPKRTWAYSGEIGTEAEMERGDSITFEGEVEANTVEEALELIRERLSKFGPDAYVMRLTTEA